MKLTFVVTAAAHAKRLYGNRCFLCKPPVQDVTTKGHRQECKIIRRVICNLGAGKLVVREPTVTFHGDRDAGTLISLEMMWQRGSTGR